MRLLDLFCGAGGAAMGYYRAGFTDITGVDIKLQKRYPFEFVQGDALEYVKAHGREYDVIHASPPCQAYSVAAKMRGTNGNHPDLVDTVRRAICHRPYIIENVPGAPLVNPVMLCGTFFGLKVYRHRLFESPFLTLGPPHFPHGDSSPGCTGPSNNRLSKNGFATIAGHHAHTDYAAVAMGIDWMRQKELAQAIPPAYTEWIGKQVIGSLRRKLIAERLHI